MKVTHQVAGAEQSTQETDVGIECSSPNMLVRVLSHVETYMLLSLKDRPWLVLRHQILVCHFPEDTFLDTPGHCLDLLGSLNITEPPSKDY